MKYIKKSIVILLTFCCCICSVILCDAYEVKAEHPPREYSRKWSSANDKLHILVKDYHLDLVEEKLKNPEYSVSNIKSTGKNLKAWKASETLRTRGEEKTKIEKRVYVGLFAKKAGEYTLTYDICDASGAVVDTRSIKVYANNDKPFKSIKINGKKARPDYYQKKWDCYVRSKEIALKVTMNKGYQLKKITVQKSLDKKKRVKNGEKIKIKDIYSGDYEITYIDKYTKKEVKSRCYVYLWSSWINP